jgi:radical SAM superfamily enzyme YgiQ (UPF0313 family)
MARVVLYACGGESPISEIPLGIGYLMSFCLGHEVVFAKHPDGLFEPAHTWDFVGFSSPAYGLDEAIALAREVKSTTKAKTILGGQGALWDGVYEQKAFDYVVLGDGELALDGILSGFYHEGLLDHVRVGCLDSLPRPQRGNVGYALPIVTSRGCPYNCAFCSSKAQWGAPRFHSVGYIFDDIASETCRNEHIREVYIVDDLFMYPKERFYDMHERWMRYEWNKRLSISGFTRTNLVNPETLRMMKEMGFPYLRIGIESGSNRILDLIGKGVTVEDHQRVIDQAHEIGLPVRGSFVRGVPTETDEDRKLTASFLEKNKGKLEIMGDYTWKPFPGSRWWGGESPLKVDMRVR